jgi:polyphenol oxidase
MIDKERYVLKENGIVEVDFFNDLDENLTFGMTTKANGDLTTAADRVKLKETLNLENDIVFAPQNHTNRIQKITRENMNDKFDDCDGFYTFESGIPLACVFGDCTPVFFYVPSRDLIAVVHAG